jgi:aminoglycoside phosphotransferase (APT) family kinase protein
MRRINFAGGTAERAAPPLTDESTTKALAFMQAADIQRLLAQAMKSSQSCRGGFALQGPLKISASAQVFRADGGRIRRPMMVKQFVRDQLGGSAADAARRYFLSLNRISALARDAGMSASEPLLLLEHHGIVVASWIEGPALSEWLLQASFHERRTMLGRAGAWLARLHRASGFEYRVPDIAEAIARLETRFSQSAERKSRLVLDALAVLQSSANDLRTRPVPWSLSHGDFKPSNLIIEGDRLVGIDVDLVIEAPNVNDAAHFLNHLQSRFYRPKGWLRWFEIEQLTECFAQEYARAAGGEMDVTLLAWRRLYNAVYLVLSHREWSQPGKAWLAGLILKHQVMMLKRSIVRLSGDRTG